MDNPVWDANRKVLAERWPELLTRLQNSDSSDLQVTVVDGLCNTLAVNGLQLGSRHDAVGEARALARDARGQPVVHCYGSGLGHLPRAALEDKRLHALKVRILNPALFSLTLQVTEQQDWLADPRTDLTLLSEESDLHKPFLTLPAEMQLASDAALPTVQALEAELTRDFTEQRFSCDNPQFSARLQQNKPLVLADGDAASLFGDHPGATAIVTGAGPGLSAALPRIKARQAAHPDTVVIAVDTSLKALAAADLTPDYVVSIDYLIRPMHMNTDHWRDVPLVYFPLVPAETLQAWPGPRFAAVSAHPMYEALNGATPLARLYSGGSVIHPAVDLAVRMGCENVILAGADFGYPGNRTHSGWQDGALGPSVARAGAWTLNGHGQRIPSDTNFNNYRIELERYIAARSNVRFYNSSAEGARIRGTQLHPDFCE
ncbi:DUF115 domain-containing protein [Granulosicoccaceae sp. 1_MG-2023]|nr:DUF115 domain-containing protein [Granulosicoccaceae sp. 1_MG-2023]